MTRKKVRLLITEQALRDIGEAHEYSIAQWGKRVANRYLADIEDAIDRIHVQPSLLRPEEGFAAGIAFYQVNKHLLVWDVRSKGVILLAMIHASRDIPSRLAELAPTLAAEVELLRQQLQDRS